MQPVTHDLLGIQPSSPVRFATMIERGLPVGALDRVADAVAPADPAFKHRVVARATLARRRKEGEQRLSPEESGRLARLARVWTLVREVWRGDEETARLFLHRPHMLLEGRPPIDVVLGSDEGARLVEDVLGGLVHGTAV